MISITQYAIRRFVKARSRMQLCSYMQELELHMRKHMDIYIRFHLLLIEIAFQTLHGLQMCYPEGCAAPGSVPCQCNTRGLLSKLEETPPQTKINVTSKSPVGDISVVTLIRTDTTLDHSQKAEKVWSVCCQRQKSKMMQNIHDAFGQRPVQLLPRIAQERTWMIVRWAAKQRHRRSE